MQILINWSLVNQRDGRRRQSFLCLYAFRNVTELFGVFLYRNLFSNKIKITKNSGHGT